jgi:hypothetical protein
VEHYNNVRLNSAIGYITPKDMLAGLQQEIQVGRDRKLEAARQQRKNRRQQIVENDLTPPPRGVAFAADWDCGASPQAVPAAATSSLPVLSRLRFVAFRAVTHVQVDLCRKSPWGNLHLQNGEKS